MAEGGAEGGQSHHPGEGAHGPRVVAAQKLGGLRVPVALSAPLEDPERRQQAQHPVEPVGVHVARGRQFLDSHRLTVDLVGYPEVGDDMKRPRRHDGACERPDDLVRLWI